MMHMYSLLWEIPVGLTLGVGLIAGLLRDVKHGSHTHHEFRHKPKVDPDAYGDGFLTAKALEELDDMFE